MYQKREKKKVELTGAKIRTETWHVIWVWTDLFTMV